jgi:hypothetical protein
MRPRKKILIFCADKGELSVLCFVVRVRYYFQPVGCSRMEELKQIAMQSALPDACVIVHLGRQDSNRVGKWLASYCPEIPILTVLPSLLRRRVDYSATMVMTNCVMADVLERVRVLAARKRGPRRFEVQPVEVRAEVEALA